MARGTLPPGWRKTAKYSVAIEMYDRERYVTITGFALEGAPRTIEDRTTEVAALHARVAAVIDYGNGHTALEACPPETALSDDTLLEQARAARNGAKFAALWAGDTSGHGRDDSAADIALASLLAFWTDRNPDRMDRLFRRSALMRAKWDERRGAQTYGERTIAAAISACSETYGSERAGGSDPG